MGGVYIDGWGAGGSGGYDMWWGGDARYANGCVGQYAIRCGGWEMGGVCETGCGECCDGGDDEVRIHRYIGYWARTGVGVSTRTSPINVGHPPIPRPSRVTTPRIAILSHRIHSYPPPPPCICDMKCVVGGIYVCVGGRRRGGGRDMVCHDGGWTDIVDI